MNKGMWNVWWSKDIEKARQERKDKCRTGFHSCVGQGFIVDAESPACLRLLVIV